MTQLVTKHWNIKNTERNCHCIFSMSWHTFFLVHLFLYSAGSYYLVCLKIRNVLVLCARGLKKTTCALEFFLCEGLRDLHMEWSQPTLIRIRPLWPVSQSEKATDVYKSLSNAVKVIFLLSSSCLNRDIFIILLFFLSVKVWRLEVKPRSKKGSGPDRSGSGVAYRYVRWCRLINYSSATKFFPNKWPWRVDFLFSLSRNNIQGSQWGRHR